jgi:two-component system, cell cycle response regulator DivK
MGKRALIIEDNDHNMMLLKDILEYAGFETAGANNGETGVRLATEWLPDIILMDIQMPVMDGFEAIKLLKADARTKGIPVMGVTSMAMVGDQELVLKAGFDSYIAKPYNIAEIAAQVKSLLLSGSLNR